MMKGQHVLFGTISIPLAAIYLRDLHLEHPRHWCPPWLWRFDHLCHFWLWLICLSRSNLTLPTTFSPTVYDLFRNTRHFWLCPCICGWDTTGKADLTPPATDEWQSTSNPQSPVSAVLDLIKQRQRHNLTGPSRQLKVKSLECRNLLARLGALAQSMRWHEASSHLNG
jgi:hypothetical protein